MVDGSPVIAVDIAHIHGANPGSARYLEEMSDAARSDWDNLIMLCTPHHKIVDRLPVTTYTADRLREWKAAALDGPALAAVRESGVLTSLDEEQLTALIERVAGEMGPSRDVALEIGLGFLQGGQVAMVTPPHMDVILDTNPEWAGYDWVLTLVIRNRGFADVVVEAVDIEYDVLSHKFRDDPPAILRLMGRNDYPGLNPELSRRVPAGDSITWLTSVTTLRWISDRLQDADLLELRGAIHLGSGERFKSEGVAWDRLALDRLR
jgi:hypothetical protein